MKRLIVIRHGKSSWELDVRDHDRVLNQRGIDDAHMMGKQFKKTGIVPQQIWTSTAARALQTATIFTEHLDYNLATLHLKRGLYTFDVNELDKMIKQCDDTVDTLMIFSHNHGLTDFVNKYGSERFLNVPTTGVVELEFKIQSWSELKEGSTQFHLFPKEIR
jgi:phosphohistidine phosphatase